MLARVNLKSRVRTGKRLPISPLLSTFYLPNSKIPETLQRLQHFNFFSWIGLFSPFFNFYLFSGMMENVIPDDMESRNDKAPTKSEEKNAESATNINQPSSNMRIMKNVLVVSLAFLLLFTSFQSLQNLQSSLNKDANLGLISLIIIYASLILSCMFVPPAMIGRLGCKWTLVISMACYSAFTAANYYPRWYTLGFTSVLLGKAN